MTNRTQPNILITGTPGVGKSSHCQLLQEFESLQLLTINQIIKDKGCHEGWNDQYQSWIVDDDKLLDTLEQDYDIAAGGYLIDWHVCDLFPESWIDIVIVLRASTASLYDRLIARKYSDEKIQENMDAEIMDVILQDAQESFDEHVVMELKSDNAEDLESNVQRLVQWINEWKTHHKAQE